MNQEIVMSKEGNAGVYKKDENKTIKYTPNAYLFSIQLNDSLKLGSETHRRR
jgi:hypothetical protein